MNCSSATAKLLLGAVIAVMMIGIGACARRLSLGRTICAAMFNDTAILIMMALGADGGDPDPRHRPVGRGQYRLHRHDRRRR